MYAAVQVRQTAHMPFIHGLIFTVFCPSDPAQPWTCTADQAGLLIPGVGVLQVRYGTTVKYLSAQLVSDAANGLTTDITEALCVRVPVGADDDADADADDAADDDDDDDDDDGGDDDDDDGDDDDDDDDADDGGDDDDDALESPVFSIVGAQDGQVYGVTSANIYEANLSIWENNWGTITPTSDDVGIFSPTEFTPAGAWPAVAPPAYSQWATTISHANQYGLSTRMESSIWSMTSDAVPVLSPHWFNQPSISWGWDESLWPVYENFVYSAHDSYLIISANPDLSLSQPGFQMASLTFIQSPCLSLPDSSPLVAPAVTQS